MAVRAVLPARHGEVDERAPLVAEVVVAGAVGVLVDEALPGVEDRRRRAAAAEHRLAVALHGAREAVGLVEPGDAGQTAGIVGLVVALVVGVATGEARRFPGTGTCLVRAADGGILPTDAVCRMTGLALAQLRQGRRIEGLIRGVADRRRQEEEEGEQGHDE